MKITYVLLADAAVALEGKFYIQGGDLTRVTPPMLPWVQTLALCIRLDPETNSAYGSEHGIEATLLDPVGRSTSGPLYARFVVPPAPPIEILEGEPRGILIALTLTSLVFQTGGLHKIRIVLDGDDKVEVPLAVVPQ